MKGADTNPTQRPPYTFHWKSINLAGSDFDMYGLKPSRPSLRAQHGSNVLTVNTKQQVGKKIGRIGGDASNKINK